MSVNESFLHVRVVEAGKTYIGGTFCRGEEDMREIFEESPADIGMDIEDAREAVQSGMPSETAMQTYNLNRTISGRREIGKTVESCLSRITSGQCAVYPINHGAKT